MIKFWRKGSPSGELTGDFAIHQQPHEFADTSGDGIAVSADARRTLLAIGLGVSAVASTIMFLGPSLRDVLAEEQDPRAAYLNILRQERGERPATAPMRATPAEASLRALFNGGGRARAELPGGARAYAPTPSLFPAEPRRRPAVAAAVRRAPAASALPATQFAAGGSLTRRSVCVRLCDGFVFPVADYGGEADNAAHSAVCAGLCPGAPTRLYVTTGGSDRLTDSVSVADRRPYSALPVAFRYVDSKDDTCSCHPPGESQSKKVSLLRDFTLRSGDKVMTLAGFRVYRGANEFTHRPGDFAPLSRAGLDKREFRLLAAIERASKLHGDSVPNFVASATRAPTAVPASVAATPSPGASRALGPQVYLEEKNSRIDRLP